MLNLHILLKQKKQSLPRNLAIQKVARRCCLLHLIKQNCLLKTSKNSNPDDLGISVPVFPSRTNLKLHNMQNQWWF